MILSHRWLGRHFENLPDPDRVQAGLEQLGVEVVGRETYGAIFEMVELVEVVARTPHPNSDHLSLVDVRRGSGEVTRIVTGASNGFVGERLWYAPPGTTLPDGRTLDVRDLRGIMSPGMLLSPEELGFQAHTGDLWIWDGDEPVGTRFLEVLGGMDTLYELEMTPNIAQYLQSVWHLAQELGAIWQLPVRPWHEAFAYQNAVSLATVRDAQRAPLYGLVNLRLVPGQSSPLWLQALLVAVGHRVIHPAVDVTNFVLWDLGEPLHAFDRRQVTGAIEVRLAQPEERLTLLDGQEIVLRPEDLVIADAEKALGLAGIMGGRHSGVADDTEEILLECAHFEPSGIFKSFKQHGLYTDAATHFGRGTDPTMVFYAPSLVIQILADAGLLANVGSSAVVGELPAQRTVSFDANRIRALLGVDWSDADIRRALEGVGFQFAGGTVLVPRWRHDVTSVYDLAEDAARFYGLDTIPRTLPVMQTRLAGRSAEVALDEELRNLVASAGYDEVVTRTFGNPAWDAAIHPRDAEMVRIANALREEESLLRRSILPSLLDVVRYNRSRHDLPIRIFEVGPVFRRVGDAVAEARQLGVVLSLDPVSAFPRQEEPSIYWLTGLADYLFDRLGWHEAGRVPLEDVPSFLHPGRSQALVMEGAVVGYVGELRPRIAQQYRARRLGVLLLSLDRPPLRTISQPGRPSRFPEVERDLSLVLPAGVDYGHVNAAIRARDIVDLRQWRVIDRFEGDFGLSLTVRLVFQSESETLTDAAVDAYIGRILAAVGAMGVQLRQ